MEKDKPMIQQTPLSWAHDASFAILQRADHRRSFFLLLLVCQAFLPLQVSQALLIDRELNSAGGGSRAQVVHARLEALLPGVEMHAAHLAEVRLGDEDVERLRLVDERTAGSGHVDESLLGDFPDRLVEILQLGRNLINLLSRENIVAKSSQWKPTLSIFFLFLIIFWLFWSSLLVRKEDFWKWIPRETKPLAIVIWSWFQSEFILPKMPKNACAEVTCWTFHIQAAIMTLLCGWLSAYHIKQRSRVVRLLENEEMSWYEGNRV